MIIYKETTPTTPAFFDIDGFTSSHSKCPIISYEIYDETCSTLYPSGQVTQPTMLNPRFRILDNIKKKKYDFCIKVEAKGGHETFFDNFTFEIKCNKSVEILESLLFKNDSYVEIFDGDRSAPKYEFPEFRTSNIHCQINSYEIQNENVTDIKLVGDFPSREVELPSDL